MKRLLFAILVSLAILWLVSGDNHPAYVRSIVGSNISPNSEAHFMVGGE